MTVCPICNGKGTQFIADYDGMYDIVCDKCKGKGELDDNGKPILTNEEWLRRATFEEMAGAIYEWYSLGYTRHRIGRQLDDATIVVEWLKQPKE